MRSFRFGFPKFWRKWLRFFRIWWCAQCLYGQVEGILQTRGG